MFVQRGVGALAAAMALLLMVAGCAVTMDGVAMPDLDATESVLALDPGHHPTTPKPPLGAAGPEGHLVEARRMAEALTQPFQVDPDLGTGGAISRGDGVIEDAVAVENVFPAPLPAGADHNFVAGFAVLRDNKGVQEKSLHNALLRFATPEDAAAAAEDMAGRVRGSVTFFEMDTSFAAWPVAIPRYPESKGIAFELYSSQGVLALTTRGPFILGQSTLSIDGWEAAAELVADTLDKQIPMLDGFTPTPVDQLAELPLDPDGVLARTLPLPPEIDPGVSVGTYGPHGYLTYSADPVRDQELFEETGVTVIAKSGATVYQARDGAAAENLLDEFAERARNELGFRDSDGVVGLPEAVCFTRERTSATRRNQHYCLATADRYLMQILAANPYAARQMLAAQYLMLTAE
ncbi:DUF7373 family lipoprotein [[Mycobacterium] wendilense]|uniref:Uncharacterized protein n=1 Tax=[Mycobacterium] wendilense TaxID=3064284 RepID=A0ABM9M7T8_9MYCO|nr:hypothetical protein [Mycolicibacterium sp. MU0050]CAJ1578332.1 hypothetical protein MU0050_000030 [Mycolicibacterium sp. MU0050]